MDFLTWHYSRGLQFYIESWSETFDWVNHYFSLGLLVKTLFSPWKRLTVIDRSPGFNLQKKFETFTFNVISRGIGCVVRVMLLAAGIIILVLTFLAGISGLFFWMTLPVFGLPVYLKYKKSPKKFMEFLLFDLKSGSVNPLKTIFGSDAGKFVLSHIGLTQAEIIGAGSEKNIKLENFKPQLYHELIDYLIKSDVWPDSFFNKHAIEKKDLFLASVWWDRKRDEETKLGDGSFKRPGIAVELTYGYTPLLNQYAVDLSIPQSFSHRLIGRSQVVSRMERILTSGNSVLLTGAPGVGKKTVVLEFAKRAVTGQLGRAMSYKRVLEFDYNAILSDTSDLNKKKVKLSEILAEAESAGNIILMIRDIQKLTNMEVEGYDFTDVIEGYLEKRNLKIIAVATNTEYERFIAPNLRLKKFLERVEVVPPTKEEAHQILSESAQRWESLTKMTITVVSLRHIIDESDRYITDVPFPEKALELLDSVVTYCEQRSDNILDVDDTNAVLAEKTGISFVRLTSGEKKRLTNIESIIHERLINQEVAVGLIAKTLRSKAIGVVKEDRPLGSFLFLGPTGVGKTETAKVLANVYYGSVDAIVRFDMAEYSGREGMERLIGSVASNQPGSLTTAIKNNPASLLLLDEIEKAPKEIYNLFLALLDEGAITDAFGKRINARHLFVIGTSNAGAEFIRQLVTKGVEGEELQRKVVNYVLEKEIFSPEFINRFDGVVVYEPLKPNHLVSIARIILSDLSQNLKKKNIFLEVTPEAYEKLAKDGFDPAFGARPMKRIVNIVIGDLIGTSILKEEIQEGDKIRLLTGSGREKFTLEKIK